MPLKNYYAANQNQLREVEFPVNVRLFKLSRVLVTGGTGFVGSHLVDGLLAEGFEGCALGNIERLETFNE